MHLHQPIRRMQGRLAREEATRSRRHAGSTHSPQEWLKGDERAGDPTSHPLCCSECAFGSSKSARATAVACEEQDSLHRTACTSTPLRSSRRSPPSGWGLSPIPFYSAHNSTLMNGVAKAETAATASVSVRSRRDSFYDAPSLLDSIPVLLERLTGTVGFASPSSAPASRDAMKPAAVDLKKGGSKGGGVAWSSDVASSQTSPPKASGKATTEAKEEWSSGIQGRCAAASPSLDTRARPPCHARPSTSPICDRVEREGIAAKSGRGICQDVGMADMAASTSARGRDNRVRRQRCPPPNVAAAHVDSSARGTGSAIRIERSAVGPCHTASAGIPAAPHARSRSEEADQRTGSAASPLGESTEGPAASSESAAGRRTARPPHRSQTRAPRSMSAEEAEVPPSVGISPRDPSWPLSPGRMQTLLASLFSGGNVESSRTAQPVSIPANGTSELHTPPSHRPHTITSVVELARRRREVDHTNGRHLRSQKTNPPVTVLAERRGTDCGALTHTIDYLLSKANRLEEENAQLWWQSHSWAPRRTLWGADEEYGTHTGSPRLHSRLERCRREEVAPAAPTPTTAASPCPSRHSHGLDSSISFSSDALESTRRTKTSQAHSSERKAARRHSSATPPTPLQRGILVSFASGEAFATVTQSTELSPAAALPDAPLAESIATTSHAPDSPATEQIQSSRSAPVSPVRISVGTQIRVAAPPPSASVVSALGGRGSEEARPSQEALITHATPPRFSSAKELRHPSKGSSPENSAAEGPLCGYGPSLGRPLTYDKQIQTASVSTAAVVEQVADTATRRPEEVGPPSSVPSDSTPLPRPERTAVIELHTSANYSRATVRRLRTYCSALEATRQQLRHRLRVNAADAHMASVEAPPSIDTPTGRRWKSYSTTSHPGSSSVLSRPLFASECADPEVDAILHDVDATPPVDTIIVLQEDGAGTVTKRVVDGSPSSRSLSAAPRSASQSLRYADSVLSSKMSLCAGSGVGMSTSCLSHPCPRQGGTAAERGARGRSDAIAGTELLLPPPPSRSGDALPHVPVVELGRLKRPTSGTWRHKSDTRTSFFAVAPPLATPTCSPFSYGLRGAADAAVAVPSLAASVHSEPPSTVAQVDSAAPRSCGICSTSKRFAVPGADVPREAVMSENGSRCRAGDPAEHGGASTVSPVNSSRTSRRHPSAALRRCAAAPRTGRTVVPSGDERFSVPHTPSVSEDEQPQLFQSDPLLREASAPYFDESISSDVLPWSTGWGEGRPHAGDRMQQHAPGRQQNRSPEQRNDYHGDSSVGKTSGAPYQRGSALTGLQDRRNEASSSPRPVPEWAHAYGVPLSVADDSDDDDGAPSPDRTDCLSASKVETEVRSDATAGREASMATYERETDRLKESPLNTSSTSQQPQRTTGQPTVSKPAPLRAVEVEAPMELGCTAVSSHQASAKIEDVGRQRRPSQHPVTRPPIAPPRVIITAASIPLPAIATPTASPGRDTSPSLHSFPSSDSEEDIV